MAKTTPTTVDELLQMFTKQAKGLDSGAVRTLAEAAISTGKAKLEQLKIRGELEDVSIAITQYNTSKGKVGDAKSHGKNLGRIKGLRAAESKAGTDYEDIRVKSLDKVTKITEIDSYKRDDLYLAMLDAVTGGRR
jgi:hypothetical protein